MLFNEFRYFFGMQKTVMNCPGEQSAKECLEALNESGTAGAFLNQISSNFAHEITIEHRTLGIYSEQKKVPQKVKFHLLGKLLLR